MPYTGEVFALITALCWAFGSILFGYAGRRVGAFVVNSIRIPIAAIILTLIALAWQGGVWPPAATTGQFGWLAFSSLLGLVIGDLCYFRSLVILGPRIASLLAASTPIFAVIISWFALDQTLLPIHLLGIAVTLGGLTWVTLERNSQTFGEQTGGSKPLGYLLAAIGALCQAVGLVAAKIGMAEAWSPLSAAAVRLIFAAVVTWIIAAAQGRLRSVAKGIVDRRAMIAMSAAAVIGPVAGIWMSLLSIQYTEIGIASTLMSTTPLWVIPLVMVIHHERPSARAIIGTVITVAGVALLFLS